MKKIFLLSLFMLCLFSMPLAAQSGKALELNGSSRYMKIPNHADFNITTSESFTISMWINIPAFGSNMRFVAKRSQSTTLSDKSGWELWGGNSATNYCAVNTPNAAGNHNNSVSVWTTDATAALNTWSHFALVIDRASGKMYEYLNGVEKATSGTKDISTWAVNNPYDVFVGAGTTGTHPTQTAITFFNGKIDNLRIWKKALSATEIAADLTATVDNTTDGLVAAYDFETVTGTTVADIKGNHPGTLVNWPYELLGKRITEVSGMIGTEVGKLASSQSLNDAIAAAQTVFENTSFTDADYTNAITALNTAVSNAPINKPVSSSLGTSETLYAIYSSLRNNQTLTDQAAETNLKSTPYTPAPTAFDNTQVWTFVELSDGTYAIVNPFSNNYIKNNTGQTNAGKLSVTASAYTANGWKVDKAVTLGLCILYAPEQTNGQVNTSSSAGVQEVFNWGYNQGTKNAENFSISDAGCQLKIVKVSERSAAAATPTTNVAQGAVAEGTEITVSAAQSTQALYYTTDGTDPKSSATRVLATNGTATVVTPAGGFTLKAYVAASQTYFTSEVAEFTYSITTDSKQAFANKLSVRVLNGVVTVDNAESFEVFAVSGQKLDSTKALRSGVYVVKSNNLIQKIVVN